MKQTKKPKLKYVIYARAAGSKATHLIKVQNDELNRIAKNQKLNVVNTFFDIGSANSSKRSGFYDMIEQIIQGRADAILTTDLVRLARNSFYSDLVIVAMSQNKLKEIKTQQMTYYNTPNEKLLLHLSFRKLQKDPLDKSILVWS